MQPSNQYNKRNTIIIIIISAILVLGLIIFGIVRAIIRSGQIEVGVYYAPFIAKVELNGKTIKNNSTIWVDPGEYSIKVSLDHFIPIETTYTINESNHDLYGALTPSDEEGRRIVGEHRSDFGIIESLNSATATAVGEAQRAQWPIISALPITNALFSIGYNITSDNLLTIIVNSPDTYLDSAINTLKGYATKEYPIANYNISFTQWTNPLINRFTPHDNSDPQAFLTQGYRDLNPDLNLVINTGKFSADNQYFFTTITTGLSENYDLVTYRAVLKQLNNSWQLISTPQPIITTYNTPNTPIDILNSANDL